MIICRLWGDLPTRSSLRFYPPSAIATPTNAPPTTTIDRPIASGRNPAQCPKTYPHKNNMAMATIFETRSASLASPIKMNGMTIGNVDTKLSKHRPNAPSQSLFVNPGRSGSGNSRSFCRINSSCVGARADDSNFGNASTIIRRADIDIRRILYRTPAY